MQRRYSSMRRRSTSVLGSTDMSAPPNVGVAIDLIARAPQTGDAIAVDVAFPAQELIDRDVVKAACFFYWHPVTSNGFDDGRLAPHRPPLLSGWQRGHLVENFGAIVVG